MNGPPPSAPVPRWLEPRRLRRLAESLREIRQDLQKESDKAVRWFQGCDGTEFFSWADKAGKVLRQQLCFKETVIEWDPRIGLRGAGAYGARATGGGYGRGDAAALDFDDAMSGRTYLQAAKEILTVSAIPLELAAPMLQAIETALGSGN